MLSITTTDALCSIAHDMKLDRTCLLERLKHSEEAIDHCDLSAIDRTSMLDKLKHSAEAIDNCDRSVLDRSVLKRCVNIPPQDGCGG